jgi:uncharacterized membrane protein
MSFSDAHQFKGNVNVNEGAAKSFKIARHLRLTVYKFLFQNRRLHMKSFDSFKWKYLVIYSILVLSDGFRGPFLWPIYKSYGINDQKIYLLYAITFFSSALFSSSSGHMADKWSKSYTLAIACIIDGISCVARFSSDFNILIAGHVLSGISYCTLFPILESWMIEKHEKAGYSDLQLQDTLAATSWLFGFVEIACGLGANFISSYYDYSSLLYCSAFFMLISFKMILDYDSPEKKTRNQRKKDVKIATANNSTLAVIALTQFGFETLLTVFISLWAPALGNAAKATNTDVPFGYIFSFFMVSVMIGSKIYSFLSERLSDVAISSILFGISFLSMIASGLFHDSVPILVLSFNIFEIAFGIYMPCQGSIRSKLLPPDRRTYLMSLLKVPTYFFGGVIFLLMNEIENLGSNIIWFGLSGFALISLISSCFLPFRILKNKSE